MEESSSLSESSSFLDQLQNKLKKGALKPTTTKVTFPDGSVKLEGVGGNSVITSKGPGESYGFVVDTKPDLTVGQVLPWLFLSSQDVPGDKEILKRFGISRILSLLPGFTLLEEVDEFIERHWVLDVFDEEGFSLEGEELEEGLGFIEEGKSGGNVLVHCNAGISRAPSFVIAYLMKMEGYSLEAAWGLVKEARPGMKPNAGFVKQLEEMERKLKSTV